MGDGCGGRICEAVTTSAAALVCAGLEAVLGFFSPMLRPRRASLARGALQARASRRALLRGNGGGPSSRPGGGGGLPRMEASHLRWVMIGRANDGFLIVTFTSVWGEPKATSRPRLLRFWASIGIPGRALAAFLSNAFRSRPSLVQGFAEDFWFRFELARELRLSADFAPSVCGLLQKCLANS